MNTLEAMQARRSIRKFRPDAVSDDLVRKIIQAGIWAPSGRNRQPWQFYVVRGERRVEMMSAMQVGMEKKRAGGEYMGSSENSARIMAEAPVTLFVFNTQRENQSEPLPPSDLVRNSVDVQSIGAAIEHMCLAAVELGLGSLWICDIFVAYDELCAWLGEKHQLVAALSLGYPDESPAPRPRRAVDEVAVWL